MNNEQKYIGLFKNEFDDYYKMGYRETSNLEKIKEWKKEMLECVGIKDCKIVKVEEVHE